LKCVIERATSRDARDSIYKISVKLTLDDDLNVRDLEVIHHAMSGATYNRADQYINAKLSQILGRADYTWNGVLARDPSKTMRGRLIRTTDMKWEYFEQVFQHGRVDYSMASLCHIDAGSAGTGGISAQSTQGKVLQVRVARLLHCAPRRRKLER